LRDYLEFEIGCGHLERYRQEFARMIEAFRKELQGGESPTVVFTS
jgi:hypothetical protein